MPNWVATYVEVSHDNKDKVAELKSMIESVIGRRHSLFNRLIPRPVFERPQTDWYEWNISNWGTKWAECDLNLNDESDNHLCFQFKTAWSPAIPIFNKLYEMGFNVKAQYLDEGWCFVGE